PWGQSFSLQPFTREDPFTIVSTNGDIIVDVPNPGPAAGLWTVRFYEYFDDDGPDASWDTITLTLDDQPAPSPAILTPDAAGAYHEAEDNESKLRANVIPALADGQS